MKLLITGAGGFLGQFVTAEFSSKCKQVESLHTFRSSEYNLLNRSEIQELLRDKPCDTIVHLAAKVGGIGANMKYPGTFLYENLIMGAQLIEEARLAGIKKFVLISTICAYPKFTPVPFKETDLWNGYPEETNAPYGLAKKLLNVQLESYRREFGMNGITLMVVNMYGPGDNFNLESSHVIPAMMRKFHDAKENNLPTVTLWGDGSPSREFIYVEDAARAIRLATESYDSSDPINIGSGSEVSMRDLANMIGKVVGFSGDIRWDTDRPNGQPRRCLDVTRAKQAIGFEANVKLALGLDLTYKWFLENYSQIEAVEKSQANQAAATE